MKQTPSTSSAFEIAGVLVVVQASLSLVAGLSALPFAIVEPGFRVLGVATIATAIGMYWLARNLRRGRRWAWRWLVSLEVLSLMMTLVLLPIGAMRGPVPLLVNVALPTSVLVLLASASGDRPAQPGPADPA
ncbi:MAG: hypothetical protein E6I73_15445 [Chloroflexi bacterium]|nr:MAG: hypothetical protein E6I73_15445 [Chloroflexota bacterium]